MPLHAPPTSDYERILVMGGPGTGKTTAYLNIARWSQDTGSDATFHVLDTDRALTRMLGSHTSRYQDLTNVNVLPTLDWRDFEGNLSRVLREAKPQDWLVVDMIDAAWDNVQEYFTEEVFSKDMGSYFLEARKALADGDKTLKAFDGWKDYTVINAIYKTWIKKLINRSACNVLCCTPATPISRDNDSSELVSLLGRYGVKPQGQKSLAFQFHTLLLLSRNNKGHWTVTTCGKDRERRELEGAVLNDFTESYLIDVAGWEL